MWAEGRDGGGDTSVDDGCSLSVHGVNDQDGDNVTGGDGCDGVGGDGCDGAGGGDGGCDGVGGGDIFDKVVVMVVMELVVVLDMIWL